MSNFIAGSTLQLKWSFAAENPDELTIDEGSVVTLVEQKDDWLLVVETSSGRQGLIPLSYVDVLETPALVPAPVVTVNPVVSSPPRAATAAVPKIAPVVPPKQFKTKSPADASTATSTPAPKVSTTPYKPVAVSASTNQFRLPPLTTSANPFPDQPLSESSFSTSLPEPFASDAASSRMETSFSQMDLSQAKMGKESSYRVPASSSDPNPFEALHQQTSSGRFLPTSAESAEDDALAQEIQTRLQALKARINTLDSDVLEAEVVHAPPKPLTTYPSSASVSSANSYPVTPRPASVIAAEEEDRRRRMEEQRLAEEQRKRDMDELREKERLRLQWESEQRAQQQQREAVEAEARRRQAQQDDFDRVRRASTVLTSKAVPEARFMLLANEKLKSAVVQENNRRYPEASAEYIKVLGYMQQAFDRGQVTIDKADNLIRMEEIVDKLSAPPFSTNGSFQGKIDVLAAMGRSGYDLLYKANGVRTQGFGLDKEKNLGKAIHFYKAAVEYYLAHKKASEAMGRPVDPSVMNAAGELLSRAEDLKKQMTSGQ